jgi:hypothetical protein
VAIRPQPLMSAVASSKKVVAKSEASGCILLGSGVFEQCSRWI